MEMSIMKKIISFMLALAVCLSLAMPVAAATKSPEKKPSSSNPKTGDAITLWVGSMAVSAAGLAAVSAGRKKEQ